MFDLMVLLLLNMIEHDWILASKASDGALGLFFFDFVGFSRFCLSWASSLVTSFSNRNLQRRSVGQARSSRLGDS